MARKEFLSAQDRTRFDYPPELSAEQRNLLMQMPQWASEYVHHLQTPTNKVGFILQLGYFRIVSRFFLASRYPLPDIEYVARRIYMDPNGVDMSVYLGTTYHRHQADILARLGYQAFDTPATTLVLQEAKRLAGLQTQPTLILEALVGFLDDHRIQIPTYATLRSLLNQALRTYEAQLETILTSHLTTQDKELLDSLLKQHISYIGATYREQLTAEGCKRVIANAINCYNLLYLSDLYQQCPSIAQKDALLKDILKTSTHSWGHINMVGEYNFVEQDNYQKFDVPTILKLFDAA
jgi:hypothetical protein